MPEASSRNTQRELRAGAVRAQTVGEVGLGALRDIGFDLLPLAPRIVDFLARAADSQETTQFRQFPFLPCLNGPLGQNTLGHIDAASDEALKRAVIGVKRDAAVEYPSILAIGALQPVMHFENFMPGEKFEIGFQALIEIFGVNAFRPLVACLLLHGAAAEKQPAVIKVVALARGVRPSDHDGRLFHQSLIFNSRERESHFVDPQDCIEPGIGADFARKKT
jgi:hypothetical protein